MQSNRQYIKGHLFRGPPPKTEGCVCEQCMLQPFGWVCEWSTGLPSRTMPLWTPEEIFNVFKLSFVLSVLVVNVQVRCWKD